MIETPRLNIIPLPYDQLVQYINNDPRLDPELHIHTEKRVFSPALAESIEHWIIPKVANPKNNFLYYTLWVIIRKIDRVVVGDLCFKSEPDHKGEIEIGYGTYEPYRNDGFMSEAVAAMLIWAQEQKQIKTIIAEVNGHNVASMIVLQRNLFTQFKEKNDCTYWKHSFKKTRSWPFM